MVQGAHGIVEFVIVKQGKFVMDLRSARAVIDCSFIKVHRSFEVAASRFIVGIEHQLSVAGIAYAIATAQVANEKQQEAKRTWFRGCGPSVEKTGAARLRVVRAAHSRQFAYL